MGGEERWWGEKEGRKPRSPTQLGSRRCFWHILCHHFLEEWAFGDNYMKPYFLLYYSPAIPNKLYFNLKQQFAVQFIYKNTIHCDHNAINLCFK